MVDHETSVHDLTGMRAMALVGDSVTADHISPAVADDGTEKTFTAVVRVDTPQEVEYYRNGGILPYVLRQIAAN
jgi:aconitate hydratase